MLSLLTVTLVVWVVLAVLIRPTLVPWAMSGATFVWVNVFGGLVLTVIALTARNARPVRSIAHVLYDAEHSSERG